MRRTVVSPGTQHNYLIVEAEPHLVQPFHLLSPLPPSQVGSSPIKPKINPGESIHVEDRPYDFTILKVFGAGETL